MRWDVDGHLAIFSHIEPYGFYEGGNVWLSKPLPGESQSASLYSAGGGVRFQIADHLNADFCVGGTAEPSGGGDGQPGGARVLRADRAAVRF